jgi:hypothetical protein
MDYRTYLRILPEFRFIENLGPMARITNSPLYNYLNDCGGKVLIKNIERVFKKLAIRNIYPNKYVKTNLDAKICARNQFYCEGLFNSRDKSYLDRMSKLRHLNTSIACRPNYIKALICFKLAAVLGNQLAQEKLSILYTEGFEYAKDCKPSSFRITPNAELAAYWKEKSQE